MWFKIHLGRGSAKIISHSDTAKFGVVDRALFPRGAFWLGLVPEGRRSERIACSAVVLLWRLCEERRCGPWVHDRNS